MDFYHIIWQDESILVQVILVYVMARGEGWDASSTCIAHSFELLPQDLARGEGCDVSCTCIAYDFGLLS